MKTFELALTEEELVLVLGLVQLEKSRTDQAVARLGMDAERDVYGSKLACLRQLGAKLHATRTRP